MKLRISLAGSPSVLVAVFRVLSNDRSPPLVSMQLTRDTEVGAILVHSATLHKRSRVAYQCWPDQDDTTPTSDATVTN